MKLLVMTLGKPKEQFITSGSSHYINRIRSSLPLEVLHLPDTKAKGGNITIRRDEEGKEILKHINSRDRLYLLDEGGTHFDSIAFSKWLYEQLSLASGRLVLQIGGPWGFSDAVRQRSDGALSLSRLTFPHELAWLILMEQLYRAAMIRQGSEYHHGS